MDPRPPDCGAARPLVARVPPDRQHRFAVNPPDHRLERFRIEHHRLVHTGSIAVGIAHGDERDAHTDPAKPDSTP